MAVEKTAFPGFDRRKGTQDQDTGVGVKNRRDWVDDMGWHGGISFLRIIVMLSLAKPDSVYPL